MLIVATQCDRYDVVHEEHMSKKGEENPYLEGFKETSESIYASLD
jgi:hypothetical protein